MTQGDYLAAMRRHLTDIDFRISQARNRLADEHLGQRQRRQLAGALELVGARRRGIDDRLAGLGTEPDCTWERCRNELDRECDALAQDVEERLSHLT